MSEVLSYSQFQEAMDAVNPKAVKKKFKDRKDKDIDNDGDVDSSDKYLHKRRKAISKAVKEDKKCPPGQYYCEKSGKCKPNSMKEETLDEGKYGKYSDLLLKKQRMKKMGQNTMVVDKEIEAEKKKLQSAGPMKMKKEETLKEKGKDFITTLTKKEKREDL